MWFSATFALVAAACGGESVRHENSGSLDSGTQDSGTQASGTDQSSVPERLYAANFDAGELSGFDIDVQTGTLAPLPDSPFFSLFQPVALAVAPDHSRLYVGGGSALWAYAIDRDSGALTKLSEGTLGRYVAVQRLLAEPSGKFLFSANSGEGAGGSLVTLSADAALTQLGSVPTPFPPSDLAVDASGHFLYVASVYGQDGDIEGFAVNASAGTLTPVPGSPFDRYQAVAIATVGDKVYICDQFAFLHWYRIDAQTGTLTEVARAVYTGTNPFTAVPDHSGHHLFVGNWSAGSISEYALQPTTGLPSDVPGSPFPVGDNPLLYAIDASDGFLYMTNQFTRSIRGFATASRGELVEVGGSPFDTGSYVTAAVAVP